MKDKWLPPHLFVYVNGEMATKLRPAMTKKECDYGDDSFFIDTSVAVLMATSPDWDGGYTKINTNVNTKYICDGYKKNMDECTASCPHLGEHKFQNEHCTDGGTCGSYKKIRCRPVKRKPKVEESPFKIEIIEVD